MKNHKRPHSETCNPELLKKQRTNCGNGEVDDSVQSELQRCEPLLDLSSVKKYLHAALLEINNFKSLINNLSEADDESANSNITASENCIPNDSQLTVRDIDNSPLTADEIETQRFKNSSLTAEKIDTLNVDNSSLNENKIETKNVDKSSFTAKKIGTENVVNIGCVKVESEDVNILANKTIETPNDESFSIQKQRSDVREVQAAHIVTEDRLTNINNTVDNSLKGSMTIKSDKLNNYEESKQKLSVSWQECFANSSETDSSDSEPVNSSVTDTSSYFLSNDSKGSYNEVKICGGRNLLPKAHLVFDPSTSVLDVTECLKNAEIEGVEDVIVIRNITSNTAIVTFDNEVNLNKALVLKKPIYFNNKQVSITRFRDQKVQKESGMLSCGISNVGKESPKFNKNIKTKTKNNKTDTSRKKHTKWVNGQKLNRCNNFNGTLCDQDVSAKESNKHLKKNKKQYKNFIKRLNNQKSQ